MTVSDETIVGKKGEILPKKGLREVAKINPGDRVYMEAREGELLIRKIYSVEEALSLPIISKGTAEEIEKELEEEGSNQERMV
ncbi:MAG: AbrB/MazE/SpoVT family DNA-binding domain-containing protein [Candidatus Hodarchaeales archaeon]|jgi:bifunctional DNA-binding transcriptional regulator/antitoxin component of YhaV-PrlF toxin-antitoxin module